MFVTCWLTLFIYYVNADSIANLQCGYNCLNNYKKYYVMKNGTCYLPKSEVPQNRGIISQKTYKARSGKFVLFRLLSGSGVHPYLFYTIGTRKDSDTVLSYSNKFENFRNPLLDEWSNIKPKLMNMTVRDYGDEVVVNLLFEVDKSDTVESWFNIRNLIYSFPWNVDYLRKQNYRYFSVLGRPHFVKYENENSRSFYINIINGDCYADIGILVISFFDDLCTFSNEFPNKTAYTYPQILYVNVGGKAGVWMENRRAAKSMEIVGTYHDSVTVFI